MKIKHLLLILFLAPSFLMAQCQKQCSEQTEEKEKTKTSTFLNFQAGFQFQFINFSDANNQILSNFDVPELEYGMASLMGGLYFDIPNTPFATSIEGSFGESCPEDIEENETQVLMRSYGFKLKQIAKIPLKNDISIVPTVGVGFQNTSLRIEGEVSSNESGQVISDAFYNKSRSENYYTEVGIGIEKSMPMCAPSRTMVMGASINYRKPIKNTVEVTSAESSFVDLTDTNINAPVLDLYFRFSLY